MVGELEKGRMPNKRRMIVKITKSSGWYKKGQKHEVGCYISLDYCGDEFKTDSAHYEKSKGMSGIDVRHCIVLEVLK